MYLDLTHHEEQAAVPEELVSFCKQDFHRLAPFDSRLLDFCESLSKALSGHPDPDIAALGFWLRPAHIDELRQQFEKNDQSALRASRGLVFHISASNVDTLFAYSWMLSLLVGNGNVVRIPTKQSSAISDILEHINQLLERDEFAKIAQSTCLLRYGHQRVINELVSAHADMRVIWGSNDTINEIRTIPLSPYAKEIAFPDRFSYAVIEASTYVKSDHISKKQLAQAFFRDAYGFDQHGCSSPRLIFWVGKKQDAQEASTSFFEYLQNEINRRGYRVPLSDVLQKQTALYVLCTSSPIANVDVVSNELSVVSFDSFSVSSRRHPGAGLFFQVTIPDLTDIKALISTQDQTLTYYGFEAEDMKKLAIFLNGKGPSRLVPIGEALQFSSTWDGFDLFSELTRSIEISLAFPTQGHNNDKRKRSHTR